MKKEHKKEEYTMRGIGIFGGTFNPIHIGHLIVAQEVLSAFKLDKIVFIPTGNPPHKDKEEVAPALDRYEMIRLAISGNSGFEVSDIEIKREGYTYTYDTLINLKNVYNDKMFFITGYDAFKDSITWKNAEKVYKMVSFIVVNRGELNDKLEKEINEIRINFGVDVNALKIPNIGISSTEIRYRVSKEQNIRYMVPDSVLTYIKDNKLYRGE